ncbi:MAG: HAD family hydrolase [Patescibacteria group bacterium]
MKIIFDYNRTIFNPETNKLYFGVLDLLKKLSKKYTLFLISRNEPLRKNRFEKFNIEKYFHKVLFVNEKTKEIFKKLSGNEKNVIVVGDSIIDEIKIGNQIGFITVRIKKGMFATEIPKNKDELANFEIADIKELKNIILNYEK